MSDAPKFGMVHHCGSEDVKNFCCPEHDWLVASFCNGCGEPYRWSVTCKECDWSPTPEVLK